MAETEYIKGEEKNIILHDNYPIQRQPWEYHEELEKSKQYVLFNIYKDLGVERSLRKLEETTDKMDGFHSYSLSHLKDLSTKNNWNQRAEAWDLHLLQQWTKNREERVHEMVQGHIEDAKTFHKKIMQEMQTNANEVPLEKKAYYYDAMTRAYERMARLERISNGEVVEFDGLRLDSTHTAKDLDQLLKDPELTGDLTTLLSRVDEKVAVYKKDSEKNVEEHPKRKEFENLYDKEEIIKKEKENWWE